MPNSKYKKGYELERQVVNAFRTAGYNAVRSAGSHSRRDIFVWREAGDANPTNWPMVILNNLNFKREVETKIYVRYGKKYKDVLHFYQISVLDPQKECVIMFQCKRTKK